MDLQNQVLQLRKRLEQTKTRNEERKIVDMQRRDRELKFHEKNTEKLRKTKEEYEYAAR